MYQLEVMPQIIMRVVMPMPGNFSVLKVPSKLSSVKLTYPEVDKSGSTLPKTIIALKDRRDCCENDIQIPIDKSTVEGQAKHYGGG